MSDSSSLLVIGQKKKAYPVILPNVTVPQGDHGPIIIVNSKLEDEHFRVACYPRSKISAATIITASGEFLLTYLSPEGSKVWPVCRHTERLDLSKDKEAGLCSLGFSESRAMAVDRRGNLLFMELHM